MDYRRNMTVPAQPMPYDTDIAQVAALMADPTRAAMLRELLSDRPLTPASRASSPAASGRLDMSVRSIAARVGSAIRAAAWAMSVSYGTARAAGARSC